MKGNDLRFIQRGRHLKELTQEEEELIKPFYRKNSNNKGHVLLLLHGFSSSPAVYRLLVPKIKHYDALVCPVLPGHAHSIAAFAQVKATEWLLKASSLCEELTHEYERVDVLGLSLGGLLACYLSQKYSFNRLFLLAPALKLYTPIQSALMLAYFLKSLGFRYMRNAAGDLKAYDRAEIAYKALPLTTIIEILKLIKNFNYHPPECPTELFLGREDHVVASEKVAELFVGLSNVNIHWLTNSAHVLPLDNDLEEIVACVNRFS